MTDDDLINIIIKHRQDHPNYLEITNTSRHHRCIVCFSSNSIFYPDTIDRFRTEIQDNDRYEWKKTLLSADYASFDKIILVRDITKAWYHKGINQQQNDFYKLSTLLLNITRKYENVVYLGVSAGGYASLKIGTINQASKIVAVNPMFAPDYILNFSSSENEFKDLFMKRSNFHEDVLIFPKNSRLDYRALNWILKHTQFKPTLIIGDKHKNYLYPETVIKLASTRQNMEGIHNKLYKPLEFDLYILGLKHFMFCSIHFTKARISRKLRKIFNKFF